MSKVFNIVVNKASEPENEYYKINEEYSTAELAAIVLWDRAKCIKDNEIVIHTGGAAVGFLENGGQLLAFSIQPNMLISEDGILKPLKETRVYIEALQYFLPISQEQFENLTLL